MCFCDEKYFKCSDVDSGDVTYHHDFASIRQHIGLSHLGAIVFKLSFPKSAWLVSVRGGREFIIKPTEDHPECVKQITNRMRNGMEIAWVHACEEAFENRAMTRRGFLSVLTYAYENSYWSLRRGTLSIKRPSVTNASVDGVLAFISTLPVCGKLMFSLTGVFTRCISYSRSKPFACYRKAIELIELHHMIPSFCPVGVQGLGIGPD